MAKPWRDLLSSEDFTAMIDSKEYREDTTSDSRHKLQTRKSALKRIAGALRQYHSSAKDDVQKIGVRVDQLQEINRLTGEFMYNYRVDENDAKFRHTETKLGSGVVRKKQVNPYDERLDRNLLTMKNRSLRKAAYLEKLRKYSLNKWNEDNFVACFHGQLPQYSHHGELGLSTHNLIEGEDFAHRDGFHGGALGQAFQEWAGANTNSNFFLWLENHPICTSQDRTQDNYKTVTQVEYVKNGQASGQAKFKILAYDNGQFIFEGQPLDTYQDGYTSRQDKSVDTANNAWGNGLAAFAWTPQGAVFIGQHQEGRFHHSSLFAGNRVKCAGMIGIQNGKVKELSNNSGHYKPRGEHIRAFINQFLPAFLPNAVLKISFGNQNGYLGDVGGYLHPW